MKIIVVADTHRNFHVLSSVIEKNLDADLFIHLGDGENEFRDVHNLHPEKKFVFVKGNCDYCDAKTSQVIGVSGYKIYCTHGHLQDVHNGVTKLIEEAKEKECKIALYGHTHLYRTELIDGVYIMNPGSLDSPRNHNKPSYGVIKIDSSGNVCLNLVAVKPKEHA